MDFNLGASKMETEDKYRDYKDINRYRELLVGNTVRSVDFAENADEGLKITLENGIILEFGFNGCEGALFVNKNVQS